MFSYCSVLLLALLIYSFTHCVIEIIEISNCISDATNITGYILCARSYIRFYADRILGTLGIYRKKRNLIFCSYRYNYLGQVS